MKTVALAGGIGAGKTAIAERLSSRGWPVIDADVIARKVVAKDEPAWRAIRDAFGTAALDADGEIDRKYVADVVFHDPSALRRLNYMTHGHIGNEIVRELDASSGPAVFVALPLFRSEHRALFHLDQVWAVLVEPTTALKRLCTLRGLSEDDARARLAVQMSNDERAALADLVFWNEGTLDDLFAQLDAALVGLGVGRD
ncbi:MAG TPA: dephospho-CoA kinase [Acidimicrobiales bacterium]|nr:dephospho-CoA kinase [Acidimicrobiales bacterium]